VATNNNVTLVQSFTPWHLSNYIISLCFYINITSHIHQLPILSPLLHDIYYQQYHEDLKCTCVTVVLNNAVLILMLKYYFVFAGVDASPQVGPGMVGITLRLFSYIKISVVLG